MIKKGNPWNFERTLLLGVSFKLPYFHKSSVYLDSMFTFLHLSFQLGFETTGLVYLFVVTFRLLSLREAYFQLYSMTALAGSLYVCRKREAVTCVGDLPWESLRPFPSHQVWGRWWKLVSVRASCAGITRYARFWGGEQHWDCPAVTQCIPRISNCFGGIFLGASKVIGLSTPAETRNFREKSSELAFESSPRWQEKLAKNKSVSAGSAAAKAQN